MKKLLLLVVAAALMLVPAAAEDGLEPWQVYEAGTSAEGDFDFDGKSEALSLVTALDEWDDGAFTLTVGTSSVTVENCVALNPSVFACAAGYTYYTYGTLFMVYEYGPSDDPITYCFLYTDGELSEIGTIPALVENLEFKGRGVITTRVRADMIGTWHREADFVLATGSAFDGEEWSLIYRIVEARRTSYTMGMPVTLKVALPVSASVYDMQVTATIPAGEKVVLASSDDVSRLYVTDYTGENAGWVRIGRVDDMDSIMVGQVYMLVDDVFDDVFYAD